MAVCSEKVLLTSLNWGIGHACRCVPIVKTLLAQGHKVVLASDGQALAFLKSEFPELPNYELPPYDAQYGTQDSLVLQILKQLPKFARAIQEEQKALQAIIQKEKPDALISDNRYGCYSQEIPSVFITHQLHIQLPLGYGWLQKPLAYFNYSQIKNFDECWIPDVEGERSLAGKLAESSNLKPIYIGLLSRFKKEKKAAEVPYEIAALISGPEPQRTVFFNLIKQQLLASGKSFFLAGGLPINKEEVVDGKHYQIVNHASTAELNTVLNQAEIVLCRSGYSSIMDLATLGKKAIFIPTPGQTEQEYLANRFTENKTAFSMAQKDFDLPFALKEAKKFSGFKEQKTDSSTLEKAIQQLLA